MRGCGIRVYEVEMSAVYFYIVNEAMVVADFAVYFVNRRREVREGVCGGYMQVYR